MALHKGATGGGGAMQLSLSRERSIQLVEEGEAGAFGSSGRHRPEASLTVVLRERHRGELIHQTVDA